MFTSRTSKQNSSRSDRRFPLPLLIAILCLSLACSSLAEEGSDLLDGRSYIGKNGEKGQKLAEYEDEEITFQDGRFTSVSCEPYNFGSSPYTAQIVGDTIHFQAVTKSPTHGEIAWQGIVDGDQAVVDFVWTKERWYWNIRREYWFRGTLKK
jgi:hypothetical protein